MWNETFDVYVEDARKLGMKAFFEKSSPFAYQDMTGRMVETIRKGYWNADPETRKKLLTEYVNSVGKHGASGAEFTSGNPRLTKYVLEQGKAAGVPVPALDAFQQAIEKSMGNTVANTSTAMEQFVARNEAQPAAASIQSPGAGARIGAAPQPLNGFLMEEQKRPSTETARPRTPFRLTGEWAPLVVAGPILAILVVWRWRRRHLR
jgi:cobaltochelatase CobN